MAVKHVFTWDSFKEIVMEFHPDTIFYISQPHLFKTPPLGLRLTFYHDQDMYVFTDYADGAALAKTGVPVADYMNKTDAEVREQDIRGFLSKSFPWIKLVSLPPFMY